jgi:hypothetical protein
MRRRRGPSSRRPLEQRDGNPQCPAPVVTLDPLADRDGLAAFVLDLDESTLLVGCGGPVKPGRYESSAEATLAFRWSEPYRWLSVWTPELRKVLRDLRDQRVIAETDFDRDDLRVLVDWGWVRLQQDPEDRHVTWVALTALGEEKLQDLPDADLQGGWGRVTVVHGRRAVLENATGRLLSTRTSSLRPGLHVLYVLAQPVEAHVRDLALATLDRSDGLARALRAASGDDAGLAKLTQ